MAPQLYILPVSQDRSLLPEEEREALAREIDLLVEKHGSQAAVGKLLACSQPAIGKAQKYRQIGPTIARALLVHLGLESAAPLVKKHGLGSTERASAPNRTVELDARYPNLIEAIGIQKSRGKLSAAVEKSARTIAMHSDYDLEVSTWLTSLEDMERQSKARKKGKLVERPLPDEDDTPPAGRE